MSVSNFIPEVWAARIFARLRKALVIGDLANRDYEGEISEAGDTVKINSIGPVTVGTYTRNSGTLTLQTLEDSQMNLLIDQMKYFNFQVDDVDARQAAGNILAAGMDDAAYRLADTADTYLGTLYSQAGTTVVSATYNSLTAYALLLTLKQKLDEKNVPAEGRYCVIPPWFETKLLLAEVIVENTSNDAFQNGKIARCAGFDLRRSNNLYNDGTYDMVMAGTSRAIAYAEQINKVEAYRPESKFCDAVKGLHVYGAKVVDPDCLAVAGVDEAAEP